MSTKHTEKMLILSMSLNDKWPQLINVTFQEAWLLFLLHIGNQGSVIHGYIILYRLFSKCSLSSL